MRPSCTRMRQRFFSNSNKDYIEKWQAATVKPNSFYEHHATDKPKKYFYQIDLQGRVFLEETLPKNIATSLKSPAFLDFFVSNLKECTVRDLALLPSDIHADYPYVSHCGVERNFVRPADAVIVFHSLDQCASNNLQLHFGATLRQRFDPSCLAISQRTGRLYHQLIGDGTTLHKQPGGYGLVKSSVAVALSEQIVTSDDEHGSGMDFIVNGSRCSIPWLSDSAEPGPSSMPFIED